MWLLDENKNLMQVDGLDRSVQFGDGFFETIQIQNGQIQNWSLHEKRIVKSLAALKLSLTITEIQDQLNQALAKLLSAQDQNLEAGKAVLKMMVSRGESARGYGFSSDIKNTIRFSLSKAVEIDDALISDGVDLVFCDTQCAIQSQLAGIKHLNRLENVLARNEVAQTQAFEGLMCNQLGHVIEGTMSNVFFYINKQWVTPRLNLSGVAGVARAWALDWFSSNGGVVEQELSKVDVSRSQSAFICNSQMGFLPVKRIEQQALESSQVVEELNRCWMLKE